MQRPTCNENGIDLILENIKYTDDTVKVNFYTADARVNQLTMSMSFIPIINSNSAKIDVDAFRVERLKSLKKLVIKNFVNRPIKKGIFNGLENLEVLNIDGSQFSEIETGVLDVLNDTLKEFSFQESESKNSNNKIFIDGFTGSGPMNKLETVTIKYKLMPSIVISTFAGLTNVKMLDLSNCQIQFIETGSFDEMNYIEELHLEKNGLTTIPDGLFNAILIRNKTNIFLEGNPFNCNCDLMPFKISLTEHSNFIGKIVCSEPEDFVGRELINTTSVNTFYNQSCVLSTTTITIASSTPTSSPPLLECISSDGPETFSIDAPSHKMQIYEAENDDVILRVDESVENSVLVWFSLSDTTTNCLIGSEPTFRIDNLVENSTYTICLMDRLDLTTSPMNCISFVKKNVSNGIVPWLYNDSKSRIIGITFVACGLSNFLGLAIGCLTFKVKFWMVNRKERFIRRKRLSRASSMT